MRGKKHLTRAEAVKFFQQIGLETTDAIQQFNKPTGLKRIETRGIYCLVYPFECDKVDIDKRKGVSISGDKTSLVEAIKNRFRKYIMDVPTDLWQIGHLDPTIDDATEANLAYQPPIQAKYRNRFKWDAYFQKMWPTAGELIPKVDEYYTEAEQRQIYDALRKKFDRPSP